LVDLALHVAGLLRRSDGSSNFNLAGVQVKNNVVVTFRPLQEFGALGIVGELLRLIDDPDRVFGFFGFKEVTEAVISITG
jgi:hypothetical protein